MLEATVKQTPIGDKYFINETLREPKTENISQVIMVGLTLIHEINQLMLIKIPFSSDHQEQDKPHSSRRLHRMANRKRVKTRSRT